MKFCGGGQPMAFGWFGVWLGSYFFVLDFDFDP